MKALLESTSSFSFTSNEDIMKSRRLITKDVFGASIDDVDIWMDTPEQSQKPKFSVKVEQKRKSKSSKQTTEEFDEKKSTSKSTKPKDERRKSKSKRSSTSGSTQRRKERATDPAAEELALVLAPLVSADKSKRSSTIGNTKTRKERVRDPAEEKLAPVMAPLINADKAKAKRTIASTKSRKERTTGPAEEKLAPLLAPLVSADPFPKTRTSRSKQPLHQERNEPLLSEDSVDFLMQRLKNERVIQPQEAQKQKTPQKQKTAESGISVEPKRFTAAALRGEEASRNKKKAHKSYLPRTSASSNENRQARQESISASLNRFLADSASSDLPPKSSSRSAYSSPVEKSKTKKVRPSRRTTMKTLDKHLQSTRTRHCQDGAQRSVASAPAVASRQRSVASAPAVASRQRSVASAPAVASRTKDLLTKCQTLKLAF